MTISPHHLRRRGLARPVNTRSRRTRTGKLICKSCGKAKAESEYYINTRTQAPQQPCKRCKLANDKAAYDEGRNDYSPRNIEQEAHNPQYAARGDKQVACPFPGCEWSGPVIELNRHRKEHLQ